jgi:hypothetical protein
LFLIGRFKKFFFSETSSFGSYGQAVSEEKVFLEIIQSKTSIAYGSHVC